MAENHFEPPLDQPAHHDPALDINRRREQELPIGQQGVPQRRHAPEEQAAIFQAQASRGSAAPRIRPRTFVDLYMDGQQDPFSNSYPAALARFDAEVEEPEDLEEVLEAALANNALPNTYLCCATLNNNARPKIYVLHKLSRYPRAFDGRETPWDNSVFAFLGDASGGNIQTVMLTEDPFELTAQVSVYNDATFNAELPGLGNDALFPRLAAAAPQGMAIRTRSMTYLPTRYAPLMLSSRGYTPKEAWGISFPALQADNLAAVADPLLFSLRATMHATRAGAPVTLSQLTNPFMDQDLQRHRQTVLFSALPELQAPASLGYDPAIMHLANAVANQATAVREDRLAREIERERPTVPSSKFQLLFNTLKTLLSVQDEAELPDFWFLLAAAAKKQEFAVVRQALDAYAKSPQAFIPQAPIPTPKMVSDLTTITLVADHNDDLKTGIQPFVVMDGSEEFRLASLKIAQSYAVLAEQQLGINLSDLSQLDVPKDLRAHPTNYYGLEKSLGLYGNLVGTVLGNNHPITVAFRSFWRAFIGREREQMHHEIDDRKYIKPVHILRNVQLITIKWFQAKQVGDNPRSPPFLDILERISLSTYTLPTLPGALYQLVAPKQPTGPKLTYGSNASTVATGLSSLTGTLVGPGSPGTRGGANASVVTQGIARTSASGFTRNQHVDAALQSSLPTGVTIRELLGNDPAPLGDDNSPLCLAYHIKGGCYNNCRRKANNDKTLSPSEKQQLSNWIIDQMAKLWARFAAP
jgi:hypothetical protein